MVQGIKTHSSLTTLVLFLTFSPSHTQTRRHTHTHTLSPPVVTVYCMACVYVWCGEEETDKLLRTRERTGLWQKGRKREGMRERMGGEILEERGLKIAGVKSRRGKIN